LQHFSFYPRTGIRITSSAAAHCKKKKKFKREQFIEFYAEHLKLAFSASQLRRKDEDREFDCYTSKG